MAGKLFVEDGKIWNERARSDMVHRGFVTISRSESGAKGGRTRAENAAKSLENKGPPQAIASSRIEENREEYTKANALDGKPVDFAKAIFENGVKFLCGHGADEAKARSMIGKWRKSHPDREIFDALAACNKAEVIDPIPWITAKLTPTPLFTFDPSKFGETAQ